MTFDEFLADRNLLAMKAPSSAVGKGLFRREVAIPLQTAALAYTPEGRRIEGDCELLLAKTSSLVLELLFPDLRSEDNFPIAATVRVQVAVDVRKPDLFKDFAATLFTFPGPYTTRDLKTFLAPELKKVLRKFLGAQKAEKFHRKDQTGDFADEIGPALERLLFGHGVRFEKLVDATFLSPEFETAQKAHARKAEDDRRVAEERDDKEKQVRRFLEIYPQVKDVLGTIPDDRIKSMVIAKLLRDPNVAITAADLSGTQGEEIVQGVVEQLIGTGSVVGHSQIPTERAEKIYVAAGSTVLEILPGDPEPKEHKFPESLRSVRFVGRLVGGSKRAIYGLADSGQALGYPLPGAKEPRGGVNSIAGAGPFYFATHSEYGLARWKVDEPGTPAELLYEDLTAPHKTTRGAQIVGQTLYFATGPDVYAANIEDGRKPVRYVNPSPGAVTCLLAAGPTVFAGTEDGSIYAWTDPEKPQLVVRKKERIITLRLAKVSGIPHLFYSTRDLAVRARALGLNLEIAYESGGASVDFLDAASDIVCASDAGGRKLLVWKSTVPTKPESEIDIWKRTGKPILDLWMKKV